MKRLIALLFLISAAAQAATVTHGVASSDTTAASSYVTGSFSPASNDLLVAFVSASGTIATGTMTDSQGLGFTKIASFAFSGFTDTLYVFVANALAANSSMTVTFDCTGDAATGANISVETVSGMSKTGATAVLQNAGAINQGAGGTPAVTFGASVLTGNPTLCCVGNRVNPAGVTEPTSWTELVDTGYNTPNSGIETASRDSGFTGTTITWGSTSSAVFGVIVVELDTTASAPGNSGFFTLFWP